MKATLVYSTRNYTTRNILVYEPTVTNPFDKLLTAIANHCERKIASKRLIIKNNRYLYTPSDEWNQRIIRFR